jgi:hypothetical protein
VSYVNGTEAQTITTEQIRSIFSVDSEAWTFRQEAIMDKRTNKWTVLDPGWDEYASLADLARPDKQIVVFFLIREKAEITFPFLSELKTMLNNHAYIARVNLLEAFDGLLEKLYSEHLLIWFFGQNKVYEWSAEAEYERVH